MLGSRSRPELKAKAAESHGLVPFAKLLLEENVDALKAGNPESALKTEFLYESAKSAVEFDDLLDAAPEQVDSACCQRLLNCYLRHCSFLNRSGFKLLPKHHLMLHGIQSMTTVGNLKKCHTYRGESLNHTIALIAAASHRASFCTLTHVKFNVMQHLGLKRSS